MLRKLGLSALALGLGVGVSPALAQAAGFLAEGVEVSSAGALSDGFDPAGWTTNETYAPLGDLSAKKGGALRLRWPAFPDTLRAYGPLSDEETSQETGALVYEPLVQLHPRSRELVGRLATHWKVSEDGGTFSFHIDPRARWADGSPVTADDVVATWEFRSRADLRDPKSGLVWAAAFEKPAADGPRIVSVKSKEPGWRAFAEFAAAPVHQAKEVAALAGEKYLAEYGGRLLAGSGPYELAPGGFVKDSSLSLRRRADYWGKDERFSAGLYNFDTVTWTSIPDGAAALKSLQEGLIDVLDMDQPGLWDRRPDLPELRKGWLQSREIRTQGPRRLFGIAFNLRRPPFSERQTRRALTLLFDRRKAAERSLDDRVFKPLDSYFPGTVWASSAALSTAFSPKGAGVSLDFAGWKDEGGRRRKDGRQLEVDLDYGDPSWTRTLEFLKDDAQRAGILLNLRLSDARTLARKAGERDFTTLLRSWRSSADPAPGRLWDSRLADAPYSGNLPGLKDARVDALCRKYEKGADRPERLRTVRELDVYLQKTHSHLLGWYRDSERLLYWDRFGHPSAYLPRTGDARDIAWLWWADPEKDAALLKAKEKGKPLPVGTALQDPWTGYQE